MAIPSGTRLGPYEVLSPLGAGGMGEVYRARDTRLGREVAVKVISDELAGDPKSLARFESEARAVAALSHPNILALHDVGEAGGIRFAVTELLEGETLREPLRRSALPVKRALEIARQIAEGLAAAHEKQIVHRDVKPENVFLTKDDHAKVLDFGLARPGTALRDEADTRSPTASLTGPGALLGTVAYMSPEQASGRPFDHRSDQFSLGIVLYEMLTGKRPFGGATSAETLTAIIREEPEPLENAAPKAPAPVRWLVERLLSKDPHGRYDSTRDLSRELRTLSLHASGSVTSTASASAAEPGWRRWSDLVGPSVLAAVLVLGSLAGALVTGALLKGTARPLWPPVRLEVRLPEGHFLWWFRHPFALSPDGRLLVFSAFTPKEPFRESSPPQLFLRPLDSLEARPIPGTEGGVQPVFSPDGGHIAFSVVSKEGTLLKRVPVAGGPVTTVCKCDALFGIAWSRGGSILFAGEGGPLQRVADLGGTPEPVTTLDAGAGEVSHRLPHLLPDGQTVVYTTLRWTTGGSSWKKARIFIQKLGEKERHLLVEDGSDGRWVPPGDLVFAREGRLLAVPLDGTALRAGRKPVPIVEGVRHSIYVGDSTFETGAAYADVSGAGLLAWVQGSVAPKVQFSLAWVDTSGKETPIDMPKGPFLGARVSPDGDRLLVFSNYPGKQMEVLDVSQGGRRNVTFGMNPLWAAWGPGPDRVTFTSDHEGPFRIYSRRIDAGPEEGETLWRGPGLYLAVGSWSRDARTLAFVVSGEASTDIWLLEAGKEPRPFVASQFDEEQPDISPDGRWLLYTTSQPGHEEVFVRPLSGEASPRQISVSGGSEPLWSRDGSAIFYRVLEADPAPSLAIFRVRVTDAGTGLSFGRPERLFAGPYRNSSPCRSWDVAQDGRFVVVKAPNAADNRAVLDQFLVNRISVDVGGLPALLEEAGKSH